MKSDQYIKITESYTKHQLSTSLQQETIYIVECYFDTLPSITDVYSAVKP